MGKPEGSEREDQGVNPNRQGNQQQKGRRKQSARGPDQAGQCAQIARQNPNAQQPTPMLAPYRNALLSAGMRQQGVKHHHAVTEPTPNQGRHHKHQRGDSPQGQRDHHGQHRSDRGAQGPGQTGHRRAASFERQMCKTAMYHQINQGRRHHQGHRQQRDHHQDRRDGKNHHQLHHDTLQVTRAVGLQPVHHALQNLPRLKHLAHPVLGGRPIKVAPTHRQHQQHRQWQQGEGHHARHQAISQRAPKRIQEQTHAKSIPQGFRNRQKTPKIA